MIVDPVPPDRVRADRSGAALSGPAARHHLTRAIAQATARLARCGVDSPGPDARALAAAALGTDRLVVALIDGLPADFDTAYERLVARRAEREPLQLVIGHTDFAGVRLRMAPGVFVPRPETEMLVERGLAALPDSGPALAADLCAGTGAIGLALASARRDLGVVGVELNPAALTLARANAVDLGLDSRVRFVAGDVTAQGTAMELCPAVAELCGAASGPGPVAENCCAAEGITASGDVAASGSRREVPGRGAPGFDLVVSNPPYIPPSDIPRQVEAREHDPAAALYGGGEDGLHVPRAVIALAGELLRPGGTLLMEHAEGQSTAVRAALSATGLFTRIETLRDLTGRDRCVRATRGLGQAAVAVEESAP